MSGGSDADPDWGYGAAEIMRQGHAWVGVSAQAVGVIGGKTVLAGNAVGLVGTDPDRYGSLAHPGDAYGVRGR